MVIGLISSIPRVVEERHAIRAGAVGEVCPLMGIDLKEMVFVITSFHMSQADVISSLIVGYIEGKLSLEQSIG